MWEQVANNWLSEARSESPTTGVREEACLIAATGAALTVMVCKPAVGQPIYAEHEGLLRNVLAEGTDTRDRAQQLAIGPRHR